VSQSDLGHCSGCQRGFKAWNGKGGFDQQIMGQTHVWLVVSHHLFFRGVETTN
jgi:hypothetical protein